MLERVFDRLKGDAGPPPPWLASVALAGRRVAAARRPGMTLPDVLNAAMPRPPAMAAGPLRFVEQRALPTGEAYESFIARTGHVPTREHPHDLFNALVWLSFPRLKRHLNELHAAQIARDGIGPTRGAVRDALTVFDENSAFLQAPDNLLEALRQRDWPALFGRHRAAWAHARLTVFGHALMEGLLLKPHKALTAHVWVVPLQLEPEPYFLGRLTAASLAERQHLPLPLSGVPGWCADNESPSFYDDPQVFRPLPR